VVLFVFEAAAGLRTEFSGGLKKLGARLGICKRMPVDLLLLLLVWVREEFCSVCWAMLL
jgi:hypothetical protein